jgi:hypothetical protein
MITGTLLSSINSMILSVVDTLPPGVFNSITSSSAFSRSADSMPRLMYSSMGGMMGPSAVNTSASGSSLCPAAGWKISERAPMRTRNSPNVR